ncbi:hypothetical protein G6F50_016274 [Rhizopus delemar]|uniref:Outer membrane protein beta-barrel domain-containing protein n=1 Tax=Rhizopus delemar TaxID=936053 RepID=A0A9P6XU92_9FUNG|nr:hypothetical protein G6F50_016274 [Rhizopus delemar]
MNKKILTTALLGGLAFAQAASAQEFDDRWYLTGSAGFNFQDNDRLTNDAPFVTLGLEPELRFEQGPELVAAVAGTRTSWVAWATRRRKKPTR